MNRTKNQMGVAKTLETCEILYAHGVNFKTFRVSYMREGKRIYAKIKDAVKGGVLLYEPLYKNFKKTKQDSIVTAQRIQSAFDIMIAHLLLNRMEKQHFSIEESIESILQTFHIKEDIIRESVKRIIQIGEGSDYEKVKVYLDRMRVERYLSRSRGSRIIIQDEDIPILEIQNAFDMLIKQLLINFYKKENQHINQVIKEISIIYKIDRDIIEDSVSRLHDNLYYGLDPDIGIGIAIIALRGVCNGTRKVRITEPEKSRAEEIPGLIRKKKESIMTETLRICEILDKEGKIDFTNLQLSHRIKGKSKFILLKEIKGIEELIKKHGLDPEFPIGTRINTLRGAYKGTLLNPITEPEKLRAEKIQGLIRKKKESIMTETLRICEILDKEGEIDFTNLQLSHKIKGKAKRYILLKEIEGIEKLIKKHRLDPNFPIGKRIAVLRGAYKGTERNPITEPEKLRAKGILGLIPEQQQREDRERYE